MQIYIGYYDSVKFGAKSVASRLSVAKLRIFISSTCYDLAVLRGELRPYVTSLGYEPVMSEFSDILYDPRTHTHDSCVKEIAACDMVVLIIGSRFGGLAIPSTLQAVDLENLQQLSSKPDVITKFKDKLSITQLEVFKAIEQRIPVYVFVDDKVLHDHLVYERNKDRPGVMENIEFPSIQKRETAKYVFEFINFLSHRVTNNSIIGFSRLDDIKSHLSGQWSQLFQRLLFEDRTRTREERRYRDFSEQIEDLKALVLASLATPDLRDTAKGAVQFRQLISFISGLRFIQHRDLLLADCTWEQVLLTARIVEIRQTDNERSIRSDTFLVLDDGTFYKFRYPSRMLEDLRIDWELFRKLELKPREAIVDALLEDRTRRTLMLFYMQENIDEYLRRTAREPEVDLAAALVEAAVAVQPKAQVELADAKVSD